jgi:hypothetical protein
MGDVGRGVFVNPAIPDFLRDQAIPCATIITPNQFEFELLTGSQPASLQEAVKVARQLRGRGPDVVIVTSLATADIPEDELGTLAVNGEGAWLVTTPRLALHPWPCRRRWSWRPRRSTRWSSERRRARATCRWSRRRSRSSSRPVLSWPGACPERAFVGIGVISK